MSVQDFRWCNVIIEKHEMKKVIFLIGSFILLVIVGCADDDSFNPLLGTWEMEKSYIGYDTPDERIYNEIEANDVIACFKEDGKITVQRNSVPSSDDYFLPSGNHTYSVTDDIICFSTSEGHSSKWVYTLDVNFLTISYYRILDMNSYPGPSIVYIFHKK